MGMFVACEILAVVVAWGLILVFVIRNRLLLWKNRIYLKMLILLLLAVAAELLWRDRLSGVIQSRVVLETGYRIFVSVCTLFLYYQILLYDMALTGKMQVKKTILFRVFFYTFLLVSMISVVAPLFPLTWFYNENLHNYNLWGTFLQILMLLICLCSGIYLIIRSKNIPDKTKYYSLLAVHCLLVIDLNMQLVLNTKILVSYITIAIIMILFYRLFHKNPSYLSHSSGCFNNAGFQEVLQERTKYKEAFFGLKICITDIEETGFSCTEEEMIQMEHRLGIILRRCCGRHNVYQIDDYEFAALFRKKRTAEKMCHVLERETSKYLYSADREISISCDFSLINSGK